MSPEDIEEAILLTMRLLWRWEGMRLRPYLCTSNRLTIGLGTTVYPDGRLVTLADPPLTQVEAVVLARGQVRRVYMRAVRAYCPNMTSPGRVAAVTSLVYNIGPGAFATSTLRRRLNAEDWEGALAQFPRFRFGAGREVPGLIARRAAEASLFAQG